MQRIIGFAIFALLLLPGSSQAQWQGFATVFPFDSGLQATTFQVSFSYVSHYQVGGIAAGDVDGDGDHDLFVLRGDNSPRLYANDGAGGFTDVTLAAGLTGFGQTPNGVLLADLDGDGDLDLVTGGVATGSNPEAPKTPIRVMHNDGNGAFSDATAESGVAASMDAQSMALADIDGDGDLDLSVAYWEPVGSDVSEAGHLWRNDGNGVFTDISQSSGISWVGRDQQNQPVMFNFTPNFTDINGDGRPDLLMAADFFQSRVLLNTGNGAFVDATDRSVISDENGMGATVGDFTNTGVMDWFVSSIFDPDVTGNEALGQGTTGNRFYRGDGQGGFIDDTDLAGVREGYWSWGTCSQDFNNDGWLDLFVVNGYQPGAASDFKSTPARLYINNGDGSFTEAAAANGIDSNAQGRSVSCFDANDDGQVDVFVQNSFSVSGSAGAVEYFRNQGHPGQHWLKLRLLGRAPNHHAVGARITLEAGGLLQTREIRAGSNFLGHDPLQAHFGLGPADEVDRITVHWPDGEVAIYGPFPADQLVTLKPEVIFSDRFR
jgi:hypothetical protein